jgi:hypothetical protein
VLLVRDGESDHGDSVEQICRGLIEQENYFELNVEALMDEEKDRQTEIGLEMLRHSIVPDDLKVRMLRQIIFSGNSTNKFLLLGFPKTPEALKEFEDNCCSITANIYTGGPDQQKNLNNFSIDSLLAKQNRLKPLKQWDARELSEQLGNRTEWGMVTGRSLSGKSTVADMMAKLNRGKIIDMSKTAEEVKKSKGTEEEPFEGEVKLEEVQAALVAMVKANG